MDPVGQVNWKPLLDALSIPLNAFNLGEHRIFWPYLLVSVLFALVIYWKTAPAPTGQEGEVPPDPARRTSLKGFLAFLMPRAIYTHPSTWVDFQFFAVNVMLWALVLTPAFAGVSAVVSHWVEGILYPFGWEGFLGKQPVLATVLITVLGLLAADFSLFITHYWQHKVPWLWEFHKVHHSAQVLTPITVYRMHPVDDMFALGLGGVLTGLLDGLIQVAFVGYVEPLRVFQTNVFYMLFYLLGYNLRHSHIWLDYGPRWDRFLISPAQHQIHHSVDPRHYDKNIGFLFAFWDDWFDTLYVPQGKETLRFGINGEEERQFNNLWQLYALPFVKVGHRLGQLAEGVSPARWAMASACVLLLIGLAASSEIPGDSKTAFLPNEPKPSQSASKLPNEPKAVAPSPLLAVAGSVQHANLPNEPKPALPSLYLEDLTWPEVRRALDAGMTTVIVPTGGTEQNGPHMVLGKHNVIVRHTSGLIARQLGNALVAPVIAYVPEGDLSPPTGHMRYAGTLTVPQPVFEGLLTATAESLKAHGFKTICFVGDSGGNQLAQENVALQLSARWAREGVQVIHVGDYYDVEPQLQWLQRQGKTLEQIGTHAGIRDTSELMALSPEGIRTQELRPSPVQPDNPTGVHGNPAMATASLGQGLIRLKTQAAVKQIQTEARHRQAWGR
jgi:creatinine amidohydrolase/Fe(II)-dependent formamide hydrolase-like protein/sterol desaturase/sphingolipid hydroxylase (fatty acid hydroxylase superfamily)